MHELLKLVTCGSVDDGKSTLIGHLMYNIRAVFTDQQDELEQIKNALGSDEIDYSLLLDGLEAEREQGITIDVAYRYFSTPKRSFIIADCPGHNEYTRNMAVGASFADIAVILIDATKGVSPQTLRHYKICSLMGIKNFVFAVNKMDLVGYDEKVFNKIKKEFGEVKNCLFLPVSAKIGDNITSLSEKTGWYKEPCLLDFLENIDIEKKEEKGFVLPVQRVAKSPSGLRFYQGSVESGKICVGDKITVYPSKETSEIAEIYLCDKKTDSVSFGNQASIVLSDDIDISRGCVIVSGTEPKVSTNFKATVLWTDDEPLRTGKSYFLKIGTFETPATVVSADTAAKNDIAECVVSTSSAVTVDTFSSHKSIGSFIFIDRITNATAACGIITEILDSDWIYPAALSINREMRATQKNQKPFTLWFTGLPASGKTTVADLVEKKLFSLGKHSTVLDGDNLRTGLNSDLGFSDGDRAENVRRTAEAAKLMNDAGLISLVSLVSPIENDRKNAAEIIGDGFILVYLKASAEICKSRDKKGYYEKASSGVIKNFTGVSSGYESPENPDLVLDVEMLSAKDCCNAVISYLKTNNLI